MKKLFDLKWLKYFLVFLFFLLISFWMPISGDDWQNYIVGSRGIRHMIGQAIGMYFDWEGRFVSRLLINFLTYYKFVFNILLAALITGGIYAIEHLGLVKNKSFFFLFVLGIFLFLDNPLFTQTILWVAGSITYLFPSLLFIGFLFVYLHILKGRHFYSKWISFLLFLFALLMPMFVENIAFSFVLLNFLLVIYEKIRYKYWNKLLIGMTFFSFIGALLMLFSPGSYHRSMLEVAFINMSFWEKIESNLLSFVHYTFTNNVYLLFLMMVSGLSLSIQVFSKKWIQILSILFFIIFPFLFSYYSNLSFIIIGWLIFLCYLYFLLFLCYRKKRDILWFHGILQLVGISSNLIMLLTPAISSRTSLLWVLCSSISWLYLLDDFVLSKIPNFLYYIMCTFVSFICVIYLVSYYQLNIFSHFLDQNIRKCVENACAEVVVYEIPSYLAWGLTPSGEYHTRTFKEYYGISNEQRLIYKKSVWKYFVFFDAEETLQN